MGPTSTGTLRKGRSDSEKDRTPLLKFPDLVFDVCRTAPLAMSILFVASIAVTILLMAYNVGIVQLEYVIKRVIEAIFALLVGLLLIAFKFEGNQ